TDELDWTELEELVESIRRSKVKSAAGRPPHLRALSGTLVFRSVGKMTYRRAGGVRGGGAEGIRAAAWKRSSATSLHRAAAPQGRRSLPLDPSTLPLGV